MKRLKKYYSKLGWPGIFLYACKKVPVRSRITARVPQGAEKVVLRPKTTDLRVFERIFIDEDYSFEVPYQPKMIVDAGAYVGLSSIYYALRYPRAHIIALEPEESNFRLLQENTAPYPNIRPLNKGLWHEQASLKVSNPQGRKYAFRMEASPDFASKESRALNGVTIDWLKETFHFDFIDVLKMDVEGAEKDIFSHNTPWLDTVGMIVIELHDRFHVGCSRFFYRAVERFQPLEYRRGENVAVFLNDPP
ncbi:MAG: FkbM family methyltransferase [Desulfohalobiaceae bacterium]|nr:FkbM family methyltransferase [Desulfohalobiaceae bacterium]